MDLTGFTQVEKGVFAPRSSEIAVTTRRSGFNLSRAAIRALGNPEYVKVLHNPETRQVAIVPTEETGGNCYSLAKGNGNVGCAGFIKRVDAQPGRTGAIVTGGALIFTLTTRPNMTPRARPARTEAAAN